MRARFAHRVSFLMALLVSGGGAVLQANASQVASPDPTVRSIAERRVFAEPLATVGDAPTRDENAALNRALDQYLAKSDPEDVAPLLAFLKDHPNSSWRASLLANLGWVYRQQGFLGRAQDAWKESWALSKGATVESERAVADISLANLADLLGRLGKREMLSALLREAKDRPVSGSAGSLLLSAGQHLEAMTQDPGRTLRCGPAALGALAEALGKSGHWLRIEGMMAGPRGTNLAQLQAWGKELGLNLQGVKLGSEMPVPSLVHWKTGHFAAVVKKDGEKFLVRNFIPGEDRWVSRKVISDEVGGVALIAANLRQQSEGTSVEQLATTWGAGYTTDLDPDGPNSKQPKPKKCDEDGAPTGMAVYNMYLSQVSLVIEDIPIWYTPPVGPAVQFHVFYNQWDKQQPQTFTYWNLGSKWTTDWLSYVTDDPANPGQNTSVYMRGGGIEKYTGYDSASGAFTPQYYHHDILVRTSAGSYERRLQDGSKEIFDVSAGSIAPRQIFLSKVIDPAGNILAFGYDALRRLVTVTDAMGKITTLSYELPSDPLKVTKVADPFGRSALLQYSVSNQLISITDMGGLTSRFTYGPTTAAPNVGADFINTLSTPYGQTTFATGVNGIDRWLQVTDPLGQSERVEYHNSTGSMPASDPMAPAGFSNTYLYYRNTFHWDKRAMASGAGDWTQATIYHFLHSNQNSGYTSPIIESVKKPLDSRVWNGYGQSSTTYSEGTTSQPLVTARVLDDGTTQTTKSEFNAIGKITKSTDALGRITTYIYSPDGVDLLEVRNTTGTANDLLAKYIYTAQHKPLTVTDAAGQVTTFTYNPAGQIQTITNPKNETTTFTYNPPQGGYLVSITGALAGATSSFTYDAFGRVQTVTSPDGMTVATDYDNLDRPVRTTYPDGTTEVMAYDKLDLIGKKDRQGQWTTMGYNPLRQLTYVQDAAGRVTRFDWCTCGSLEQLTDPMGRITNWWRDLQGRVIGKQLHDQTLTSYGYDSAGRLTSRIDAKGQLTQYNYFLDNNLAKVSYPNPQTPTPAVNYTYDGQYNRLASMVDQFGTTTYAYNPVTDSPALGAGRLASVAGPFPNSTITYGYDELGRVTSRRINGTAETRGFDSLGRVSAVTNPLGVFQYAYQGSTGRLDNILLPNGQKTVFSYFDASQDFRLQGIFNQKSDATVISAFTYTYNPDGTIKTWGQQADAQVPSVYSFSYDAANQLIGALLNQGGPTGALIHQYVYGYDLAGNRTSEQIDGNVTAADFNTVNQMITTRNAPIAAPAVKAIREAASKKSGGVVTSGRVDGAKSTKVLPSRQKRRSASTE